ncbi:MULTISPECIES: GIY-YIG nuclease family protein [Aeromicrobium]|uniref:GIY-YIG nuclease family protein n=1 Tax=Aeromicrobium TaxID=2040 RepID=UPI00257C54D1|nr:MULTISPECIES: GIY-YIG nuclease family protein [Aeromicrobium]
MAHVYILRCADGSYYVGSSRNLAGSLHQHQTGTGAEYTRHRLPVELLWSHEFASVVDAFAAEKRIQGWSRAKREALMRGDFHLLPGLAKKRSWRRDA